MTMKIIYNQHHRSLHFKINDQIFFRLYKKYTLFFIKTFKSIIQRIKSFKILKKKENLIYKLNISKN